MVKIIDISSLGQRFKDDSFDEVGYEQSIQDRLKSNHGK